VAESYRAVVLASGHMIDSPDRPSRRFPPALEPAVAAEIERVFDEWRIGPGDLVLDGGARGADILFSESAARRGAAVEIVLASPAREFERTSVELPRSIWVERFRDLLAHHRAWVAGPEDGDPDDPFARANARLIRRALELAPPARLHVALVWDGRPAGGPGGTGDFAALARDLDAPLAVIDPTSL
jgi:hypothetical protein